MLDHEIVRLRCAQGAPLPKQGAGAEIQELGKSEPAGPAVEEPKPESGKKGSTPTPHTGQGLSKQGKDSMQLEELQAVDENKKGNSDGNNTLATRISDNLTQRNSMGMHY